MIRIDVIWLALGASDLRCGIDKLLTLVVHGFTLVGRIHAHQSERNSKLSAVVEVGLDHPRLLVHGDRRSLSSPSVLRVASLVFALVARAAPARTWPSNAVRWVVACPAGSGSEFLARQLAPPHGACWP